MQKDPLVEWQNLTELYGRMYDDELRELAADSGNLTEVARQVLGDELKKRGLTDWRGGGSTANRPEPAAAPAMDAGLSANGADETGAETDLPHEYTWKTVLCACEERDEAWQIYEALRRAGIESWIERAGARQAIAWDERMVGDIQVLVAADQLEEAQAIAARPIPQEIIEESKMQAPEFEPPKCPKCGAEDPVLAGIDPANTWECEGCGYEWTEAAAAGDGKQGSEEL